MALKVVAKCTDAGGNNCSNMEPHTADENTRALPKTEPPCPLNSVNRPEKSLLGRSLWMVRIGRSLCARTVSTRRFMTAIELCPSEQPKSARAIVVGTAAKSMPPAAASSHGSTCSMAAICGAEWRL
nr:hypothetical protein [Accumulibacter sp.]